MHGIWHALSSQRDWPFRTLTGAAALTTVPQCSKTMHSCTKLQCKLMLRTSALLVPNQDCVQQRGLLSSPLYCISSWSCPLPMTGRSPITSRTVTVLSGAPTSRGTAVYCRQRPTLHCTAGTHAGECCKKRPPQNDSEPTELTLALLMA